MQFATGATRLVLCSAAALFWELALIRWQGSCIRVVAYYSNFILISALFGLGVGALLARRTAFRFERFLAPALTVVIVLGVALGRFADLNPGAPDEFVWAGTPPGVATLGRAMGQTLSLLPFWLVLGVVYVLDAVVFAFFGHWIGRLFRDFESLRGYSLEIAGSILGVVSFGIMSALRASPTLWFAVGFVLLFAALERSLDVDLVAVTCLGVTLLVTAPLVANFVWSPYYKIDVGPLQTVADPETGQVLHFNRVVGYTLEVNNDYHQMMLDLSPRQDEPAFLASWRTLYEVPYRNDARLPEGPVLVVGAGTGNDVAAALRKTRRRIDAVDIDPSILELGLRYHFEQPYQNPRVRRVVDDARSFFQESRDRYALIVFGFLDSHTLLSSFSSLRLDNFVYTEESMRAVRERLLPGGEVYLTFASNNPWIDERIVRLMNATFDRKTQVSVKLGKSYTNGIVYRNVRAADEAAPAPNLAATPRDVPTDDWPFLYLRDRTVPAHYRGFMILVVLLGFGAMALLPPGERRLRFSYFFMGAAFFLIETSNVVRLSILYGSTWIVNIVVFAGILVLILFGNLTSLRFQSLWIGILFGGLFLTIAIAYLTPTRWLLGIPNWALRGTVAVAIFLGPVYFASLIFAKLIRNEPELSSAYGSNLLGAVVGGACEYFSLVVGFRALLLVTFALYLVVFLLVRSSGRTARLTPSRV